MKFDNTGGCVPNNLPLVIRRPHPVSRLLTAFALALSTIGLLLDAGASYAGYTGPFCAFTVCEIANPNTCWFVGLWQGRRQKDGTYTSPICADTAGSFVCEHGSSCIFDHGRECDCIGPGIAETAGLFLAKECTCDYGLKAGCYVFDHDVLKGPMNLKTCKAVSALIYHGDSECWCIGGGNREGSKGGP